MALGVELIGPYCLLLATSSVCAVWFPSFRVKFEARIYMARMSLPISTAAAL